MKGKLILILVLVSLLMSGCYANAVRTGTLRDTLFSVEETNDGAWRVFMTHDDVAGYCTLDSELGQEAHNLLLEHDGEVMVEFTSIKLTDESYDLWSGNDCNSLTGNSEYMAMYELINIQSVSGR